MQDNTGADQLYDKDRIDDEMDELPKWERDELDGEPKAERRADAEELEANEDGVDGGFGGSYPEDSKKERKANAERKMGLVDDVMGQFMRAEAKRHPEKNSAAAACVMEQCLHVLTQCEMDASCSTLLRCMT